MKKHFVSQNAAPTADCRSAALRPPDLFVLHKKRNFLINQKPLDFSRGFSAAGGTRTHTLSPASDFESDASASSATSA